MKTYRHYLKIDVSIYNISEIKSIIFKSNLIVKLFDSKIIETERFPDLVEKHIVYTIDIKTEYKETIELEKIIEHTVKSMLFWFGWDLLIYLEPIKIID